MYKAADSVPLETSNKLPSGRKNTSWQLLDKALLNLRPTTYFNLSYLRVPFQTGRDLKRVGPAIFLEVDLPTRNTMNKPQTGGLGTAKARLQYGTDWEN
jgi:hypothetical protein